MLKKVSITGGSVTFNVTGHSDNDLAVISLVRYEFNEDLSTENNDVWDEDKSVEVYVDTAELREMVDGMNSVLKMLEREGE